MAFFEKKETTTVAPEIAECDRRIAELGRQRTDLIMQIGQMFLANNTPDQLVGSPYEGAVNAFHAAGKEMVLQEKRKLASQGLRKCEKCGNVLVLDSAFCNKCGEKLGPLFEEEPQAQSAQSAPVNACPNCGTPCEPGAMFCTSCGTKLG